MIRTYVIIGEVLKREGPVVVRLPDDWINSAAFILDWRFLLERRGLWNAHLEGSFFQFGRDGGHGIEWLPSSGCVMCWPKKWKEKAGAVRVLQPLRPFVSSWFIGKMGPTSWRLKKNDHCANDRPQRVLESCLMGPSGAALQQQRRTACYFDFWTGNKEVFREEVTTGHCRCVSGWHSGVTRRTWRIILNRQEVMHEVILECSSWNVPSGFRLRLFSHQKARRNTLQ